MKTLSYAVIVLFAFAVPVRAAPVYSGCAHAAVDLQTCLVL